MAITIAANAWIDPRAEVDKEVEIGPFCMIGPGAKIGRGTRLLNNVTVMGDVTIGRNNLIYPNVVLGAEPQDVSYTGGDTCVEIGEGNTFREGVTVNRGTEKEDGITRIGNKNFFMGNVHIAHDCKLGDHIIIANGSLLAGHVHVEDYASISGGCAIHHFVTVGKYSFLAGLSRALHDVPPYMLAEGIAAHPRCINIVALKRRDFSSDAINSLAAAHRLLYRSKVGLTHAREILRTNNQETPEVQHLLSFIDNQQEGKHGRGRELRRAA
ncbi:acyl-ACP--UDP-N-acetylglucosamine O-acyltransferase [Bythopirellula goksoeyrii]|uniref:Acyl-[acyl-carrier-protein]--UDP-N-acetylglucosamine O-acyltransferase n=1 Tax=Bythopirellula goksoeyrii TaxID=1400387 RepID=A0A5B9Q7Q8_9BACT|nr:acyl-ACP--UDP-N-acetylglucosamine O-acyltransferase [Bythopirellula goksoeyrii]QEG35018.1 Acyl-[acyl-carrier-protein]--UDP-N-acetylglucosamine O-acyltransferase [Bythopirellula goksoeyrii]